MFLISCNGHENAVNKQFTECRNIELYTGLQTEVSVFDDEAACEVHTKHIEGDLGTVFYTFYGHQISQIAEGVSITLQLINTHHFNKCYKRTKCTKQNKARKVKCSKEAIKESKKILGKENL